MKGALAIFAKTPGISPVKTRLAKDMGERFATEFYSLSVKAISEIAETTCNKISGNLQVSWALAEKEALVLKEWQNFDVLWTGEGDLGERLNNIYSCLQKYHDYVILIGTDSPQLTPELIIDAIQKLFQHPESCVIGPALDGGFYLFAAKRLIEATVWQNIVYSTSTTLDELKANLLMVNIDTILLQEEGDIDTKEDLETLYQALNCRDNLLPAQKELYKWLQIQRVIIPQ